MTKQDFFLNAAAMIAAQRHAENRASDEEERSNINTYAADAASELLVEVQIEWERRTCNSVLYGRLFDADPQQANTADFKYALHINYGDKLVTCPILADSDAQAILKAMDIYELEFVKRGAKGYILCCDSHIVSKG